MLLRKQISFKEVLCFTVLILSATNIGIFWGYEREYYWVYTSMITSLIILAPVMLVRFYHIKKIIGPTFLLTLVLVYSAFSYDTGFYISKIFFSINLLFVPLSFFVFGLFVDECIFLKNLKKVFLIVFVISFLILIYDFKSFHGLLPSNSFSGAVFSAVSLIFLIYFVEKKDKICLLLFVLSLFFLFVSQHRAGILALFISFSIIFFFNKEIFNFSFVSKILLYFFLLFCFSVIVFKFFPGIIEKTFFSLNLNLKNINFSGRLNIWDVILRDFFQNNFIEILFGNGLKSLEYFFHDNFYYILTSISVPHNEYIRIVYEMGFLGLISYLYFIKKLLYVDFNRKISIITFSCFAHYLTEMLFSNVIYMSSSYFCFLGIWCGTLYKSALYHTSIKHKGDSFV